MCEEREIGIFSDEMYRGMNLAMHGRNTLPSAVDLLSSRGVSLSGLSKWGAMPGLRAGWLIAKEAETTHQINTLKDYTTICPNAVTEFAASIAVKHRERIIERSMHYVEAGAAAARAFCSAHEELIRWREPLAGSVSFPQLRLGSGPWSSATDFCEQAAAKAGLWVVSCLLYLCSVSTVSLTSAPVRDTQQHAPSRSGFFCKRGPRVDFNGRSIPYWLGQGKHARAARATE